MNPDRRSASSNRAQRNFPLAPWLRGDRWGPCCQKLRRPWGPCCQPARWRPWLPVHQLPLVPWRRSFPSRQLVPWLQSVPPMDQSLPEGRWVRWLRWGLPMVLLLQKGRWGRRRPSFRKVQWFPEVR